ncbi:AAA family ATPase [Psychrobacillus antarcticus]|uniref:AAA family ATPase n=1 Tax=Psychrobacillus antarcticus TaxID=2879115 RepID=UPI0024079DD1|nr:AAA family ATPase [Psychrobacillus antarcticus]
MKRLVVMTVGKTHSGKTTFAEVLEKELLNSVVIDQDNHAEFLHTHYQSLLPKQGSNTIKYAITQAIVNHAVQETTCHLILCNSNRNRKGRLRLIEYYQNQGFTCILVNFELPDHVLKQRIAEGQRSTKILRVASTFAEVLSRQQVETNTGDIIVPTEDEAEHLFTIKSSDEIPLVIRKIVDLAVEKL